MERRQFTEVFVVFCSFCLICVSGLLSAESSADEATYRWQQELSKIEFLLAAVEQNPHGFIRNGTQYDGAEAAAHLRMKLKRAQNWWFAPPKEKWSVELFIDKVASGSSISGKPYLVKDAQGQVHPSGEWLRQRLAEYEQGADSLARE